MGVLNKMDEIERVRHYLEQLSDIKDKLNQVSAKLEELKVNNKIETKEYVRLYEKEFELSMSLSGIHGDINILLDKAATKDNSFVIKRLRQEADKIFFPVYLEV